MTVLRLNNIRKSYKDGEGQRTILDGLNLELQPGEFAAILGPSGSGKSTLLSIAGLLLSADEGQIILADKDLSNLKKSKWTQTRREHLGFIFQQHELLSYLTIAEQLALVAGFKKKGSKNEIRQEIIALLEQLGIADCIDKYPQQLSGGQKQRAAIARAFISQPDVILADEPTASLDPERGRIIVELIHKEVKDKNKAALIVTHDHGVLEYVDTVYELKDGRLVRR
ncbi:MAG: ABC transporter ATP-binding protein [Aerococcaceae bacterium]|nr:ABC transporter ATP-binding protein [Aerococcaceae bacterium]